MASAAWYTSAPAGQWSATAARRVDWVTDSIICSLHTSAYTLDPDNHVFFSSVTNELVNNGSTVINYARQTLGTKSVFTDVTTNTTSLRAANSAWAALTAASFRYAVIWKDTGVAGTSPLLGFVDLVGQGVSGVTFTIDWDDTAGVLQAVVS